MLTFAAAAAKSMLLTSFPFIPCSPESGFGFFHDEIKCIRFPVFPCNLLFFVSLLNQIVCGGDGFRVSHSLLLHY